MEGMEAAAHNPPALKTRMGFNRSSSSSNAIGHKTRMGFNLIEAAIVLAVVGLVVAGIWYAASAVRENQKVTRYVSGVILGANKLRSLVVPGMATGGYVMLDSLCINANVFPSDDFPVKNGRIQNPFGIMAGPGHEVTGKGLGCYIRDDNNIMLALMMPTVGVCQKFLSQLTSRFKNNSDLLYVELFDDTNNRIAQIYNYPVSPNGNECKNAIGIPQIRLYFSYTRIN